MKRKKEKGGGAKTSGRGNRKMRVSNEKVRLNRCMDSVFLERTSELEINLGLAGVQASSAAPSSFKRSFVLPLTLSLSLSVSASPSRCHLSISLSLTTQA
jgi:hypothetical protein